MSWWCTCPGTKDDCRRPTERGHRTYYWALRVDTTDRDDVQVKRGGYATQAAATGDLERVRELLAVAGDDDGTRRRIADLVIARSKRGGVLPDVDEVRRRYGAGLDPVAPSMTLGEWLDEWLAGKRRVTDTTRDLYAQRVNLWKVHLGDVRLDLLREAHVAGVLDWIERRNRVIREAREAGNRPPSDPLDRRRVQVVTGPKTQQQVVHVLRMALNKAIKRRLLTHNACDELELVAAPRHRARVWEPGQVRTFIESMADHRLGALYRLVLLHGPRRGEVCGLRWSDVDLDRRTVTIRRSMRRAGPTGVDLGTPKTDDSERTISVDPGTADALRRHKKRQREERLAAGAAWLGPDDPDEDWVFARPDGSPTPPVHVTREFKRRAAELDLPVIRLHDGRHTAATLAFEDAQDVKLVSERLGHANTRITLDLYTHVRRAQHDRAAERIERLIFPDDASGTEVDQTTANERGRG